MAEVLGYRLQAVRNLYGWSQRELARRAGVPHSAISVIEHDDVSPSIASLEKILAGFPLALNDFFSLSFDPKGMVCVVDQNSPGGTHLNGLSGVSGSGQLSLLSGTHKSTAAPMLARGLAVLLVVEGDACIQTFAADRHLKRGDSVVFNGVILYRLKACSTDFRWSLGQLC